MQPTRLTWKDKAIELALLPLRVLVWIWHHQAQPLDTFEMPDAEPFTFRAFLIAAFLAIFFGGMFLGVLRGK
jgi:hypothetical protein